MKTWADELGLPDAARLLKQTLDEELATDKSLTMIAKSVVNIEAELNSEALVGVKVASCGRGRRLISPADTLPDFQGCRG